MRYLTLEVAELSNCVGSGFCSVIQAANIVFLKELFNYLNENN
jgi:hypothetical protein